MATIREWVCDKGCRNHAGSLFSALRLLARGKVSHCATHKMPEKLRLEFPFGLNASHNIATVEGCFTPRRPQSWLDKRGKRVRFLPFLVLLKRHGRRQAVWLPYWHLVEVSGRKEPMKKYGQWAPFMDMHLFKDLLAQAQTRGFLHKIDWLNSQKGQRNTGVE